MNEIKKIDSNVSTNIKNEIGHNIIYTNIFGVGKSQYESIDSFDRIINKHSKYFLYDEMSKNESLIGAFNNLIESFATSEELYLKESDSSEEAKQYKNIVEDMLNDMEIPFSENIKDWLTMSKYGFAVSEICFKKRLGNNPSNPKKHSKFNDGLIGIRKFAPRHQKLIDDWVYDKFDRISFVKQLNPNTYSNSTEIPYNRILHFKIKSYNGNPWGQSIYRTCALSYYNKKNIMREQRIRNEKGFVGIPVIKFPPGIMNTPEYRTTLNELKTTVKNIRTGQDVGLVMPAIYNEVTGKEEFQFYIESGKASAREDTDKMIDREDSYIAISLLADMFITGKSASISGSLAQLKVSIFTSFVSMLLSIITDELNNKLLPALWDMNGFPQQYMPKFCHTNLSKLNMTNLMLFLQSLGKTKLFTKTLERENALTDLIFNGTIPHVTEEEFERQQRLDEVNTVDNLDNVTVDNFDDLYGNKREE